MNARQIDWKTLFAGLLAWECGEDVLRRAQEALEAVLAAGRTENPEHWPPVANRAGLALALRWCAPQALVEPVWLRAANSLAHGHEAAHARLFAIWLDSAGLDGEDPSLAALYRAFARDAGFELPPPLAGAWRKTDLPQAAFRVAAVHLALERAGSGCFPELLGYTLAHWRVSGAWLSWLEKQCRAHGLPLFYLRRYRALLREHRAALFALARAIGRDTPDYRRFLAGWRRREWVERHFLHDLRAALSARPSLAARAAALLDRLRPFAVGHHGKIALDGKNPDDWLAAGDWEELRLALRASTYFTPDAPKTSPLLRAMSYGGPMFGIFSSDEENLLCDWLAADESQAPGAPPPRPSSPALLRRETPPTPKDIRSLFHQLVNESDAPPVLDAAERHVRRILRWTAPLAWLRRDALGFSPYAGQTLREHVYTAWRREMARYRPPEQRAPLPCKLCAWCIEQLAPAILVDGCWLRHLGRLEPVRDGVMRRLTRIFSDETGAGRAERHHGNVYRQLLTNQGIHLPPLASREFAENPRLKSASFVLPAYLLAIGAYPESYFPELLGLNLAIELSGLGAGYMHAVDDMRRHGIDPLIVQLHLSIDNLANGHAALALEAIEGFLEETQLAGGADAVAGQWKRVRRGFLSLRTATAPFALAAAGAWLRG
jgi:hypothetical protein